PTPTSDSGSNADLTSITPPPIVCIVSVLSETFTTQSFGKNFFISIQFCFAILSVGATIHQYTVGTKSGLSMCLFSFKQSTKYIIPAIVVNRSLPNRFPQSNTINLWFSNALCISNCAG